MAKQKQTYKIPKRKQRVFRIVRPILKLFFKPKPKIYFLEGQAPQEPAIFTINHVNKKGPMMYELYFPVFCAKWGAGQMLGNYKSRFRYLRDVLYIQKNGLKKFPATLKAGFEALFSIYFYRGMKILPTFTDARFMKTISYSVETLKSGTSVMIFPEDSSKGYFDIMTEFLPGFIMLAETYYKKTGVDLPVYPAYYDKHSDVILIGKPEYVQDYVKQGATRPEICEAFKNKVNALYTDYIQKQKYED